MVKRKIQKFIYEPKKACLALSLATVALIINFWAWSLLGPLGAKLSNELFLSPTSLAFLLAVPVIIGSLGRIVLGIFTDKFGGKAVFTAICFIAALPVVALAFSDSYSEIILVATCLGISGASFVVGVPFVSDWFPVSRRGLVLGVYSMGNMGTALSGLFTPRLDDFVGRQSTFLIVATLLIFMGSALLLFGKNSPNWKSPKSPSAERLIKASKSRLTWDLSVVYVITFGAFVAFGVYLPVLLKVQYDLSLTDASSRAAGFVLLATLARPFGGWLSDKISGKVVIKLALIAVIILATIVALEPTLQLRTTIAYLSLSVALGFGNGAVFAMVGKLSKPEIMGSVTGIVGACGGLGGFLPPLILGVTYQATHSYSIALIMLALCALLVLIFVNKRFKDKSTYSYV